MKDRIRAHLAAHRQRYTDEIIELTTRLVALRTVNAGRKHDEPGQEGPGEETRVVDALRPWLDDLGVPYEVRALDPRRANLIATLGTGGKVLAVGCHADVVPAGDGWSTDDPYTVTLEDGMLIGRGVLDNKGPMVSSLAALRLLVESGVELGGRFQLVVIASEEFRERDEPDPGIGWLLEQGHLGPDLAIIPDIGENMRGIDIAEKGRIELTVTAIGQQAHGSTPERGVNAVYAAARLATLIEGWTPAHVAHPVLGRPTVNLGIIRGGSATNIVPGECTLILDIRYVPGQTPEGLMAEVHALTEQVGGEWRLELGDVSLPHAIPGDNDLVHTIQANTQAVLGFKPEPFGMGGGTFAKSFNLGGIPAVGWGPGDDEAFHVADEYIEIEQLVDFAELLALTAVDLLG